MAKAAAATAKPMSKTEVISALAEKTTLSKKEVAAVLDGLTELISTSLGKKGPKLFNFHGLAKIKVVEKKATKARQGINPKTGEAITIAAKPARKVVKVVALKALKEMI